MKANPKSVSLLIILWLWSYTKLVYAAAVLGPFSADVQGYDFESLLYAAGAGLLGGAGRTIYLLASDKMLVGSIWRQGAKDGVIATMSGAVAFVIVTWLANRFPALLTSEARMIIVVASGASGGKYLAWAGDFIDVKLAKMTAKAQGRRDAPPSSAIPLEGPK